MFSDSVDKEFRKGMWEELISAAVMSGPSAGKSQVIGSDANSWSLE